MVAKSTLERQIKNAYSVLEECRLCPRKCGVNRLKDEPGFCGMGKEIVVSSWGPHFGEEPPLVGQYGSGTIFLSGCNLGCIFCQNYAISHFREGHMVTVEQLVKMMIGLQNKACHNINFVTPTHFTPQIMKAIFMAREQGLEVPVVYNCGGYESVETLKLLKDFIEIYMPDIKYSEPKSAKKFSDAEDYPEIVKKAILEMHRQVGDLVINEEEVAKRGLLIRHLVLPRKLSGPKDIFHFVANEISTDTYINIMDQYRPMFDAREKAKIGERLSWKEYREAIQIANEEGLWRGFSN